MTQQREEVQDALAGFGIKAEPAFRCGLQITVVALNRLSNALTDNDPAREDIVSIAFGGIL